MLRSKASKFAVFAAVTVADVIAMLETPASASSLYTFSTFVVPGYAKGGTFLSGINDRGQVVGGYGFDIDSLGSQAFVATDNNITTINAPGFLVNDALGINNMGQIVGSYRMGPLLRLQPVAGAAGARRPGPTTPELPRLGSVENARQVIPGTAPPKRPLQNYTENIDWRGFIESNGSFTSVDVPGADATQVFGINNRGQIVGTSTNYSINKSTGFIYSGGRFTSINVPGAYETTPLGINDSGEVVGQYQEVELGPNYGFIESNGHFASISVPGSIYTVPTGINDRGQVVGYYLDDESLQHGFVDYDGIITTFNVHNTYETAGFGINDRGQIVGGYIDRRN